MLSTITDNEVFLFVDAMLHSQISHITVKSLSEDGECLYIPEDELMKISQDAKTKNMMRTIKMHKELLV